MGEAAPVIVTALFAAADFAFLDGLRRTHFPPERNVLPAHLTLFHHLPPSALPELSRRLTEATHGQRAPKARLAAVMSLGRGVAFRVESAGLEELRAGLAEAFSGLLTPQDAAAWRPHVTVQNKVDPAVARALKAELEAGFRPRPLAIAGLASWRYRGGPWAPIRRHMFA